MFGHGVVVTLNFDFCSCVGNDAQYVGYLDSGGGHIVSAKKGRWMDGVGSVVIPMRGKPREVVTAGE
jgi:hypothetical protein